jgi:hypothetical protein
LLRQIFGFRRILDHAQAQAVDASAMRLVKEFEGGVVALLGLLYGFCLGQVALCLSCYQFLHIAPLKK